MMKGDWRRFWIMYGLAFIPSRKFSTSKSSASRSYVDVVLGLDSGAQRFGRGPPPSFKDSIPLSFSADEKDLDWLKGCMVGKTVETVDPRLVSVLLKAEGFLTVSAHSLGGDLVLISPTAGEDLKGVLNDAKDWISAIFSSFVPWSEDLVVGYRNVWLQCQGIPPHAWNVSFFHLIAKEFGSLRSVDDATKLKVSFENCYLFVRTPIQSHISRSIEVLVNGKVFSVEVWEDVGFLCCISGSVHSGNCNNFPSVRSGWEDDWNSEFSDSFFRIKWRRMVSLSGLVKK
ncbi:unnamed protein product [Lupinus luteus]|uniref:DUF4283 domain-containing protein n=1 Tax=Lupinus luteus TaxID=3873 RepID=A0AAV1W202_LUPLU